MNLNIVGGPVDDDVKNWVEQAIANSTSEVLKNMFNFGFVLLIFNHYTFFEHAAKIKSTV